MVGVQKCFLNWLKQVDAVAIRVSIYIRLWTEGMQKIVSKTFPYLKTHLPLKVHSLHQLLYWARDTIYVGLDRFAVYIWAHLSC